MKQKILALACVLFSLCSISAAEHLLWNFGWRFATPFISDAEARVYVQAVDSKGRAVNNYEGEVTISVVTIEAKTPGLKSAKTSVTSN